MSLHQRLFYLLIFLLPIQFSRHFWPDFSFIFGIRVDYLSPTIYLTDIIVLAIVLIWAISKLKRKNLKFKIPKEIFLLAAFIFFLLLTSILVAQNQGAALYKLIKIFEFSLLGIYVYKTNPLPIITTPLSLAVVYSGALALGQFFLQRAIGGPFWFLGERSFSLDTPGITTAVIWGQEFLRPYSVFPHPNAMSGFLLVSLILITRVRSSFLIKLAFVLGLATIFISFSQAAWIASLTTLLFSRVKKNILSLLAKALLFALVLGSLLLPFIPGDFSSPEVAQRASLAKASAKMITNYPLTGVGINNFIVQLPQSWEGSQVSWFLQPVHNIFLLVFSEAGIFIFIAFIFLFWKALERSKNKEFLFLSLIAIAITGFFDHYWLTLQQNQLLFTIALSLALKSKTS